MFPMCSCGWVEDWENNVNCRVSRSFTILYEQHAEISKKKKSNDTQQSVLIHFIFVLAFLNTIWYIGGVPAAEALRKGLSDLHEVCQHVLNTFEVSLRAILQRRRMDVFEWISTLLSHFIILYSPITLIHYLVEPSLAPVILSIFSPQSSILGCIVFCFILICAHQGWWPFSDLYTVKPCSYCSSKSDSVLCGLVKTWFKCGRVYPCSLDQRACLHVHWLTAHATVSLPKLMSLSWQLIQVRAL